MRSLMDRLKALEPGGSPETPLGSSAPATRAPDLMRWFGVGFACAWLFGGIALLFTLPADAMPSLDSPGPVLIRSGVTSESSSLLEARLWGWKLSLSVDRTDQKLARRD